MWLVTMFYIVAGGLYLCGLVCATTGSDYIVARVGHDVTISLNTSQAGGEFKVGVEVNDITEYLFIKTDTDTVIVNSSHTWYRDREIPMNITPSEFRFTLYNVTTEDAGLYECRTFDTKHRIPGCEQLLVVAQKPSQPSINGPTSADTGGRVTLTCSSSSRSLPPDHPPLTMTYIWRRNSEKIQGGEDVHVAGQSLAMRHISKAEDGNYSCQAVEEGLESDWSHGRHLDVQYGPEQILFNGTTSTVTAVAGAPLTVRCSADCNPACTVTWWNTFGQRLITGQREAVLSIPAVDRSGQYICHVNNTHGNTSRNLKLDKPNTPMSSLLVPAVVVLLLVVLVVMVLLLVCGIRRCRRLRAKRKLRYAAYLTALNNRASSESPYATVYDEGASVSYSSMRESSATSEQHYATANYEGVSLPVPSHRSDATADYVALGQEGHVHIYTALRPQVRQQV